jgi:hypothetical protein
MVDAARLWRSLEDHPTPTFGVILLSKHLSNAQIAQPECRSRTMPSDGAWAAPDRRDPKDTASLADEVLMAIARLLGRQAAREWFRADG